MCAPSGPEVCVLHLRYVDIHLQTGVHLHRHTPKCVVSPQIGALLHTWVDTQRGDHMDGGMGPTWGSSQGVDHRSPWGARKSSQPPITQFELLLHQAPLQRLHL